MEWDIGGGGEGGGAGVKDTKFCEVVVQLQNANAKLCHKFNNNWQIYRTSKCFGNGSLCYK